MLYNHSFYSKIYLYAKPYPKHYNIIVLRCGGSGRIVDSSYLLGLVCGEVFIY